MDEQVFPSSIPQGLTTLPILPILLYVILKPFKLLASYFIALIISNCLILNKYLYVSLLVTMGFNDLSWIYTKIQVEKKSSTAGVTRH